MSAPTRSDVRTPDAHATLQVVREAFARNDWRAAAAQASKLPPQLEGEWIEVADGAAFALGQLHRHAEAITLLERVWAIAPSARCAGSLAYVHYAASMELGVPQRRRDERREARAAEPTAPELDRETLRKGFRCWIAEALRREPGSPKHLYRLGVFEAQIESRHDKVALRAFLSAIEGYRALDAATRARRHDLAKYHARALYAGARSALRLGQVRLARRLAFDCIRADQGRDHVEPLFKLGLAAKICVAAGEHDAAERAVRLALDADGPRRRDHLHALMATVLAARGEPVAALAWLDQHVRPEQRRSPLWRKVGDLRRATGDLTGAEHAYQTALQRDRMGRHLTFARLAELAEQRGAIGQARHLYERALEFRRRQYSSDDPVALAALERLRGAEASPGSGPGLVKAPVSDPAVAATKQAARGGRP